MIRKLVFLMNFFLCSENCMRFLLKLSQILCMKNMKITKKKMDYSLRVNLDVVLT